MRKQFKFYLKEFLKINITQSKNSEYYFANIEFKGRNLFKKIIKNKSNKNLMIKKRMKKRKINNFGT